MAEERQRLDRAARLGGHQEKRPGRVGALLGRPNGVRVGGIEHRQARVPGRRLERLRQYLRAETAAAHAEQEDVAETLLAGLVGQRLERGNLFRRTSGQVEPAERVRDLPLGGRIVRPGGAVLAPNALCQILGHPTLRIHPRHEGELSYLTAAPDGPTTTAARLRSIAAIRSSKDFANAATPSSCSLRVTASRSIPTSARRRKMSRAPSRSCSRVGPSLPWSRKASMVAGGMVLTVCGPISSSTYMTSG